MAAVRPASVPSSSLGQAPSRCAIVRSPLVLDLEERSAHDEAAVFERARTRVAFFVARGFRGEKASVDTCLSEPAVAVSSDFAGR